VKPSGGILSPANSLTWAGANTSLPNSRGYASSSTPRIARVVAAIAFQVAMLSCRFRGRASQPSLSARVDHASILLAHLAQHTLHDETPDCGLDERQRLVVQRERQPPVVNAVDAVRGLW